jgi:hypothetical protein
MATCARNLSKSALALLVPVVVVVALAHLAAQAPAKQAAKPWSPPRLADGHPDFSGFYDDRTATPLERDRALGTKEFYTDQEFAELAERQRRGENRRAGNGAQEAVYDRTVYGYDTKDDPLQSTKRTSLVVGPEGRIPPQVPEAVQRNAARAAALKGHEFDSHESFNLEVRCIISNLELIPMIPAQDINNHFQVIQGAGYVVIAQEISHDTRVIPTDGRPHISPAIRQLQGDSVGHWEGDTLVIDTTNFTNRTAWRGSSEKLHLVERLTWHDADTILYRFTVEDPATWAAPWTAEVTWEKTNARIYEYACQEGNDAIRLALGGARAQEREAAKKNEK